MGTGMARMWPWLCSLLWDTGKSGFPTRGFCPTSKPWAGAGAGAGSQLCHLHQGKGKKIHVRALLNSWKQRENPEHPGSVCSALTASSKNTGLSEMINPEQLRPRQLVGTQTAGDTVPSLSLQAPSPGTRSQRRRQVFNTQHCLCLEVEVPSPSHIPDRGCIPQRVLDTLTPSHSALKSQMFQGSPQGGWAQMSRSCQWFPLQPQDSEYCGAPPFLPVKHIPSTLAVFD